jgi:RNA polymerase sigma-70 factor (ECF subfamily)
MATETMRKTAAPVTRASRRCVPDEAVEGHMPSVERVYAAHFAYVYRCLRHLGVCESFLDDATQDVFVVVSRKLHAFDGHVPVTTWLYAIVLRVARRYRERQAVARRFDDLPPDVAGDASDRQDARMGAREALDLARRALDSLDDGKREVYVLHEIEEMTAAEVAAITNLPVNTVYSRLRAARLDFENAAKRLALRRRFP